MTGALTRRNTFLKRRGIKVCFSHDYKVVISKLDVYKGEKSRDRAGRVLAKYDCTIVEAERFCLLL